MNNYDKFFKVEASEKDSYIIRKKRFYGWVIVANVTIFTEDSFGIHFIKNLSDKEKKYLWNRIRNDFI